METKVNSIDQNEKIASVAIKLLKKSIKNKDKIHILIAYEMIEDESFSWKHLGESISLDIEYATWNNLTKKVNGIFN